MATVQESARLGGLVTKYDVLNKSSAKVTYSFGKGQRFPSVKRPATQQIGYDLPNAFNKKTCGFGVGNRFQTPCQRSQSRSKSPEPGTYTLKSEFEIGKPGTANTMSKAGIYSFGIGRHHFEKVYLPFRKTNTDTTIPGPGTYEHTAYSIKHNDGRKFNMQGRTKNPSEPLNINIRKNIPGPGSYGQGIEINKYGVYRLSTIENSRAAAWSPSKKRFEDDLRHKRQNPGPGDYYPCDQISGTSQYLLSNFKSYGTRKYMPDANQNSSRNQTPAKSETPGPGQYPLPSDFGYLEMRNRSQASQGSSRSPRNRTAGTHNSILGTGVRNSSHISGRKQNTARRNSLMTNMNTIGSNFESGSQIDRKKSKMSGSGQQTPKQIEFCHTAGPGQIPRMQMKYDNMKSKGSRNSRHIKLATTTTVIDTR